MTQATPLDSEPSASAHSVDAVPVHLDSAPYRVLLVEDSPDYASLVQHVLGQAQGASFEIDLSTRLDDALERLEHRDYDVMLLDLSLPDSYGTFTVFSACSVGGRLPVIVLTATDSDDVADEVVRAGAEDYLVKDKINPRSLSGTIVRAIERHSRSQQGGHDPAISRDELTGLPTVSVFGSRLESALQRASRHGLRVGVMHLEIEGLRDFKRHWGAEVSSAMLKEVASHLRRHIRSSATVARLGPAAFGIVLDDVIADHDIERTASALPESVSEVRVAGRPECDGDWQTSIGVATYPYDGDDVAELLLAARLAQR